jgi:predicted ATPase
MDATPAQREKMLKSLQELRAAQGKLESLNKDLNEKIQKVKTVFGVNGENATKVIEAAWMVMGQQTEKLGFKEED